MLSQTMLRGRLLQARRLKSARNAEQLSSAAGVADSSALTLNNTRNMKEYNIAHSNMSSASHFFIENDFFLRPDQCRVDLMQNMKRESSLPTPSSSLVKRRNISSHNNEILQRPTLCSVKDEDQFKGYKGMTMQFYVTMQRVLRRSNTQINSSSLFNRPELMQCNPFVNHSRYQFNNMNSLTNIRSFSSSASPDEKNKDTENKDASNSNAPILSSSENIAPTPMKPVSLKKKEESMSEKAQSALKSAVTSIASMIAKTPGILYFYLTHPKEFKEKMLELKEAAKKEAHHYYMGSKLLIADIKTARQILARTLNGTSLTRRERKQLLRTVTDVFRLVPMSIFVLIPFMEFALPFALKIWPNMLPSTFQDNLKAEESMKRELKSRLAMAEFFQETLQDLAKGQKKRAASKKNAIVENDGPSSDLESIKDHEETAESFLSFIEKARKGEFLPPDAIIRYAKYFKDELTLDNMPRMQLINMCRYMNIPPYGNDNLLRFQLRHKIRVLQEDDQRILWEGIHSLTKMELREACQERGMRSTGLSKEAYVRALQQWIDLSVNRNVPISLLIMSRTFFLQEEMTSRVSPDTDGSKSVTGLADAISGMEKEVLNNVILESVSADETPEFTKLKLEVLKRQNELIEEEKQQRDAEAAKKAEKEKLEQEKLEKEKSEKEKAKEQETITTTSSATMDSDKSMQESRETDDQNIIPREEFQAESENVTTTQDLVADQDSDNSEKLSQEDTEKAEETEERSLSSEELDAISQMVSPDPVSAERATLESIKAALQENEEKKEEKDATLDQASHSLGESAPPENQKEESTVTGGLTIDNMDETAAKQISSMDTSAEEEARESTKISLNGEMEKEGENEHETHADEEEDSEYSEHDRKLDKAIARLKSKVESMVGNLEIQISDVEAKIGDKMHLLDKDMDGILSREEMAITLQSVLKRPLTFEEAMAIASDMDENKDGLFSVDELSKWLETTKLVKLVEEGRDSEVDKIISAQAEKMKEKKKKEQQ